MIGAAVTALRGKGWQAAIGAGLLVIIIFLLWRLDTEAAARDAAEARAAMLLQQMAAIELIAERDAAIGEIVDSAARAIEETDDAPLSDPERAALRCLRDPAACVPAEPDDR